MIPTNAIAVVGTQVITRDEFESELSRRRQVAADRYADPAAKQALLDELICIEVLHQKALAAGYLQDPEIMANLRQMIVARYQEDQFARLAPPAVDAEDVADYYQKHPERFGTPEQVRVALIEFKISRTASPEKRAEMLSKAQAVLTEARATETPDGTFGLLAQNHSDDQASRYRGGDVGWMIAGDTNAPWPTAVMDSVSKLAQPGELAPVVETPAAFYLVKLVERRPASARPLEEVRDGIEYLVGREKEQEQQQALYRELQQGLQIRINQPLLDSMDASAPLPPPPGLSVGSNGPTRNSATP